MCHTSVLTWAADVFGPDLVTGRTVCEVGSYDVNGTVRPFIMGYDPLTYVGVDISEGPGVDLVANVGDLPELFPDGFGLVASTEMLEHVESWKLAIQALIRIVEPGGTLALSTRSPGFPYHPFPIDTFRYTPGQMRFILETAGLVVESSDPDPEQAGVFAVATKPADWTEPEAEDWWPGVLVPLWDGSFRDVAHV